MEKTLENTLQQRDTARIEAEKPFVQEEELKSKSARLAELDSLLNMDKRESEGLDTVPEQEEERPIQREEPDFER